MNVLAERCCTHSLFPPVCNRPYNELGSRRGIMKQKGFGIIELMVVLGIIAILGAIALPQYNKYVTRLNST